MGIMQDVKGQSPSISSALTEMISDAKENFRDLQGKKKHFFLTAIFLFFLNARISVKKKNLVARKKILR